MADITKAEFHAYEAVRLSGVTNMYAISRVMFLSGLSKEAIQEIQKADYAALRERYGVPASVEAEAEEMRSDYA